MRNNRFKTKRGGYVLMLVAMLLFGLFAMAALVIDIGFARLAQRQMQSAADSAALEGLRFRDQLPPNASSTDLELVRRSHVQQWVLNTFDDDFGASSNSHTLGAGPVVNFDDRPSNHDGLYANEFIHSDDNPSPNYPEIGSLPLVPVYRPSLATNLIVPGAQIDPNGDMVSGTFSRTQNPNFDDNEVPGPAFNEYVDGASGQYIRRNFVASTTPNDNAFLVRIRRTGEILGSNIGTSGPTIPFLFGRASTMPRDYIGTGMRVRATSIAKTEPVVCVGEPVPASPTEGIPEIQGKLGYAVPLSEWQTNAGTTFRVYQNNAIGGEVTMGEPTNGEVGYIAIYSAINGIDRVIGYGPASILIGTMGPEFSKVAPFEKSNASATFCYPFARTGVDDDLVFESREVNRDVLFQLPVSAR